MRIEKCWFCSSNIYPGKGIRFVRGDCTVFNFCRSKCYKLFKLRRNPRKVKWTKISRMIRGKQIVDHPINEFEKRMDEPMIYSREKFAHAIAAIPQIISLKEKLDMLYKKEKILSAREESKIRDIEFINKYQRLLDNDHKVVGNTIKTTDSISSIKDCKSKKTKDLKIEFN